MIFAEGTKFNYTFRDGEGKTVGTLLLPTYLPVPENGRLNDVVPAKLKDFVRIDVGGKESIVKYEVVLPRRFNNELKFSLVKDDTDVISAVIRQQRGFSFSRPPIEIEGERQQLKLTGNSFFGCKFSVERNGTRVGRIYEPPGITLFGKKFCVDLPNDLSDEGKIFIFFLAVNRAFR